MPEWLVSLDIDQIKRYVFATGRLREIQGASAKLAQLNEDKTVDLISKHQGEKIYSGGGSTMATFSSEKNAESFRDAVIKMYPNETGGATATGIVIEYDPDSEESHSEAFGQKVKQATAKLKSEKMRPKRPGVILGQSYSHRCQRCGLYPATDVIKIANTNIVPVCKVCKIQRNLEETLLDRFARQTGAAFPKEMRPSDINDLGEWSKQKGYIGYIFADGNGIGNLIENYIGSRKESLLKFSDILKESIWFALEEALKAYYPNTHHNRIKFIPVLVGGDDIILITSSDIALTVANTLCLAFKNKMSELMKQNHQQLHIKENEIPEVVMSAGVAIAKSSHPIFALDELATELLQSAKRLNQKMDSEQFGKQCTVDFRVITTPSAKPLLNQREQDHKLKGRWGGRWSTAKPYPCQDVADLERPSMEGLIKSIESLKNIHFPKNKIHMWGRMSSFNPPQEGMLRLVRMMNRLPAEQKEIIDQVASYLFLQKEAPIFLHDRLFSNDALGADYISPLPDLTEIYEYI